MSNPDLPTEAQRATLDEVLEIARSLSAIAGELEGAHEKEMADLDADGDTTRLNLYFILSALNMALLHEKVRWVQDDPTTYYRGQLKAFARISRHAGKMGMIAAVRGVQANAISRKEASEILGVHQATVARWVKAANEFEAEHPRGSFTFDENGKPIPVSEDADIKQQRHA